MHQLQVDLQCSCASQHTKATPWGHGNMLNASVLGASDTSCQQQDTTCLVMMSDDES